MTGPIEVTSNKFLKNHFRELIPVSLPADVTGLVLGQRRERCASRGSQGGIALVVAMILLIVITLVGLAAVRGTIMQQKMTANFYDRQLAFQTSEIALRQAEAAVQNITTPPGTYRNCSPTASPVISCPADPFSNPSTLPAAAITTLAASPNLSSPALPQYVIEYMGYFSVPPSTVKQLSSGPGAYQANPTTYAYFYRLTARSGSPAVSDRAVVTLQSVYRR